MNNAGPHNNINGNQNTGGIFIENRYHGALNRFVIASPDDVTGKPKYLIFGFGLNHIEPVPLPRQSSR